MPFLPFRCSSSGAQLAAELGQGSGLLLHTPTGCLSTAAEVSQQQAVSLGKGETTGESFSFHSSYQQPLLLFPQACPTEQEPNRWRSDCRAAGSAVMHQEAAAAPSQTSNSEKGSNPHTW